MADQSNSPHDPVLSTGQSDVNQRVQELTWALIDEQISGDEMRLLDNLLLSDESARDTYIGCVQLHTDLLSHYSTPDAEAPTGTKSPVLGFLGADSPPLEPRSSQP